MWKLMQFCIAVAVIGSNGAYHWTDNGYIAGGIAVGAAFLVTATITELLDLRHRLLAKKFRRE